jgi:uncharacterized DUF497 family protein
MPFFERFDWDPNKDREAVKKGRRSFEEAVPIFDQHESGFIIEDTRKDYGERRFCLLADGGSKPHRLTFTQRDTVTWIISAHRISDRDFEKTRNGPAKKHNLARCVLSEENDAAS